MRLHAEVLKNSLYHKVVEVSSDLGNSSPPPIPQFSGTDT
jgi:hypothetical protein